MGKYDNISTGSNSTTASSFSKGPSLRSYKPSKQGAAWLPLMRGLDKIKKPKETTKPAAKEKLKINPAPAANSTPSGGGGTTTTQGLQIDPEKGGQKGGGQKPPKKKKPPKKDSGTPTDTSGGGSSAGAANL